MKLNFGKRLVLFLHWLLSLIVLALVVLWCVAPQIATDIPEIINRVIGAGMAEIAGVVVLAVYALLAILSVAFIFSGDKSKKRSERGFITVDSSEAGRTRIAIGAVEQMIRQAVRAVDGIADMKSSIVNSEDAISINTSVAILSGAHVPTVTMNIQRAIRSYIELNCGVAVREVCVSVHTLTGDEESGKSGRRKAAAASAPVVAAPAWQPPVMEEPKAEESVLAAEPEAEISAEEAPVEEPAPEEAADAHKEIAEIE